MDKSKINLLVIEDEEMVRESYIDMFALLGYEVDTAENGKDGLNKISQKDYDIVITDLNMPVMDGLETLKRIKRKTPNVEVIVMTGFATIENAINAMKEGAFDYITKPVGLDHVKIVLTRCVQHIQAKNENKTLRDVNEQLKHVNELKDKFITITNHELRTPLAVLKGYFELIEMSVETPDSNLDEYFKIISGTINEMIDLVERMHNLSATEKNITAQQVQSFNLLDAVVSVGNEMKVLFTKRGINFGVFSSHRDIRITADRNNIHRALREILQNALKFTEKDGSVSIRVKKTEHDKKVYIAIQDSGIGIPADKINFIFEPFYEVQDVMHHSTSQTAFMGGGIGVGLSLVKEIIDSAKGDIIVQSTPGKGSTFTIILPYQEVENEVAAEV